ncbi:2-5-dichloro-2-5-cyclohexadiene-1-4-diol dehydrogenase [Penicillium taxi]|uniref:2-5-dichloro-2-5-cyclohexadiene-1-4-diol dehydrogenase n=1 Tax=Penicillium taxi TaxID=168475 RepID=UPI0025457911|nr:2-5-dichloro-2-5-cyclohexadiene-1-4-diol dehydrogenase [Penicillium taxi]KAJ5895664.1 2-5-dichloro-2-5-cyclohexadiene-1-4-diol dehydrogenase [Penicillium taxi]
MLPLPQPILNPLERLVALITVAADNIGLESALRQKRLPELLLKESSHVDPDDLILNVQADVTSDEDISRDF